MRAAIYLRVSTVSQARRNNEPEGYSIPAQRRICTKKAQDLGATTITEYADRGVSARTDNRPALQRLLGDLNNKLIDVVIVHKLDRLARNRRDDAVITWIIGENGAKLVSVAENIDSTPQGQLLQGVTAAFAEFVSRNQSQESLKGGTEKARRGGTPYRAPTGYQNVIYKKQGREVRTVEVNPRIGPHIAWAFKVYATGDYSGRQICDELTRRGVTTLQLRPFSMTTLYGLLRNRYYAGFVGYRGEEHPGVHPPLVSPAIFARVQALLDSRRYTAERARKHRHYLRGLLRCARCDALLQYHMVKNRFEYYSCRNRHLRTCSQPYFAVPKIEAAIEADIAMFRLSRTERTTLHERLQTELVREREQAVREVATYQKQIEQLTARRQALLNAYLDQLIDATELPQERNRLRQEISDTRQRLDWATDRVGAISAQHSAILGYGQTIDVTHLYQRGDVKIRRFLLQAIGVLLLDDTSVQSTDRRYTRVPQNIRVVDIKRYEKVDIERLAQAILASSGYIEPEG